MKDSFGNEWSVEVKCDGNKIIKTESWVLEEGKSTLRGAYQKFKPSCCAFPERLDCNYGPGYERCKHMKCHGLGDWSCELCFQ